MNYIDSFLRHDQFSNEWMNESQISQGVVVFSFEVADQLEWFALSNYQWLSGSSPPQMF